MVSSTVLTLVVIPAVYVLVKGYGLPATTRPARSVQPFDARDRATAAV